MGLGSLALCLSFFAKAAKIRATSMVDVDDMEHIVEWGMYGCV